MYTLFNMQFITFLGYYHKSNYGDDYFEYIFTKLFSQGYKIAFFDPNSIDSLPSETDIIVCGGGDIVNDYFMHKIYNLKKKHELKTNKKLFCYLISVGITYKKSIFEYKAHFLDMFDYFIVRNKIDEELLVPRYGTQYVKYLPDIVHGITKYNPKNLIKYDYFMTKNKVIGVFLTATIFQQGKNPNYDNEVKALAKLIDTIPQKYDVHLVPFNLSKKACEDDTYLNDRVFNALLPKTQKRTFVKKYSCVELLKNFMNQKYAGGICMRYHSHVLCNTYKIPFVSLSMTNKTFEFMKDMNLEKYMTLYPNIQDSQSIIKSLQDAMQDKTFFKPLSIDLADYIQPVQNLITRTTGPIYFTMKEFDTWFNNLMREVFLFIFGTKVDIELVLQIFSKTKKICTVYEELKLPESSFDHELITKYVIFKLHNTYNTEYNYGFQQQIFTANIYDCLLWLFEHKAYHGHDSHIPSNSTSRLNFTYIDNVFSSDIHRAGWHYVSRHVMEKFNNNNGEIIVDLYVDKTFLWNSTINEKLGKIPYTKPWVGFIHHTPDPDYSENSLNHILESELFKKSLKNCKGLIVLSNYLRDYLSDYIQDYLVDYVNVPIHALIHPTEDVRQKFSFKKFSENKNKKVIQIGGWLRDVYSIYSLQVNYKLLNIKKCILPGKDFGNYVKPKGFNVKQLLNNQKGNGLTNNICQVATTKNICQASNNKFIAGLIKFFNETYHTVTVLPLLSNNDFDDLLSRNIVFLNLINASASNTVMECIIRNTPIIINRIEAIEEILGCDYPLFYDNLAEAGSMVTNIELIKKGHMFLKKMDKTCLSIDTFMDDFEYICNDIKL